MMVHNPERFLTREAQFCNLCYGQGKGWVRIISVAAMVELRKGRSEASALKAYRARRRRAILRHLTEVHPLVAGKSRIDQAIEGFAKEISKINPSSRIVIDLKDMLGLPEVTDAEDSQEPPT